MANQKLSKEDLKRIYAEDFTTFQRITKEYATELGSYVYALTDPRGETEQVFYVGKGTGMRVLDHVVEAVSKQHLSKKDLYEKIDLIQQIHDEGCKVKMYILHYGLTTDEALLVESVMIDVFNNFKSIDTQSLRDLTTRQRGHDCEKGLCNVATLNRTLKAKNEIEPKDNESVLVIRITETLTEDNEIYERVRKYWRINPERANKMTYVAACNNGVVIGLYQPKQSENGKHGGWQRLEESDNPDYGRCYFEGEPVKDETVRRRYIDHVVRLDLGAQNPVRYIENLAQDNN